MIFRYRPVTTKRCARAARQLLGVWLVLMSGCENLDREQLGISKGPAFDKNAESKGEFYTPLREPTETVPEQGTQVPTDYSTQYSATPRVRVNESVSSLAVDDLASGLKGPSITVNYNNIPLPNFINQVFGEQLGMSFTLQPEIHKQQDLVTLRITTAVSPAELFRIARTTLAAYGVVVNREGGVLVFLIDRTSKGGQTPLLVSGRTLPDVPDSQRPIFMFVPLEVVSNAKVKSWLGSVMTGFDLEVQEDPVRNAVVLIGKQQEVEQALSIVKSLDQPLMRGKYSMSVRPAYVPVKELANDLERILQSEGYDASQRPPLGSVIVLPLEGSNSLVVFAPTQQTLDHVRQWVDNIDRERQIGIDDGIFSYQVSTTAADNIVEVLNSLESGAGSGRKTARPLRVQPSDAMDQNSNEPTGLRDSAARRSASSGRFVVDANRNAVVFRGSGQEWLDLLPTIRAMDRPAPAVLVEVLIAEVTLTDKETTGVEWLADGSITLNGTTYNAVAGTLGGLGIGSSGFNLTLDNAGETRAVLNLFYENKRAEIRSRPRLMVMSGQSARIDVGDEIPIVSSSSRSIDNPDAPIVNNVEYRKTGVKLEIRPTVHASGYVDVEVNQELSQAQETTTSDIDSPTIFNRSIQTTVSLKDGGSILLGGLVSSIGGNTTRGVPILGQLPLIGKLFRTDGESENRTELMVLVIPYVVRSPEEAAELSRTLTQPL
ncbi:MAG: general secretion pathway protein GspD [Pseudomonadales bacterium]|nr:general secretion pathway protein GspD [Pseudomonadales bacterium]